MKKRYLFRFAIRLFFILLCFSRGSYISAQLLDPSFGNNGKVITKLYEAGDDDIVKGSVLQPDGKIVVAGMAPQSGSSADIDAIAVRFNEDGSLDASFGVNGISRLDATYSNEQIFDVALQPDGKLVLAGGSDNGFLMIRLRPDGSLDSSFAVNGAFEYNYSINYYEQLLSVSILPDGKILAAGFTAADGYMQVITRLMEDGAIDSTFGNNGFIEEGNTIATKIDMAIDDMNRILICGTNTGSSVYGFEIERFNSEGIPDSSFGNNGLAIIDFDTTVSLANAIILQPDGKILIAGSSDDPANFFAPKRVALCRLLTDGTPDLSFGISGKVITDFVHFEATASSIIISSTGKIIAGGTWKDIFGEDGGFFMLRCKQDGSIDSVFGTSGLSQTNASLELSLSTPVLITPNDKILFSGSAVNGISRYDFFISKFKEEGKQDTTFGTKGITWVDLSSHLSQQQANDLALLPDGSMIITGIVTADFFHGDLLIGKYKADGMVDSSFGESGNTRIAIDNDYYTASSVVARADGSIVTGGTVSSLSAVIIKFGDDGKQDPGFGDHGMVKTKFGFYGAQLNNIAVDPNGKIVGCGTVFLSIDSTASLLFRLNSNGDFDSTFSDDGILEYDREQNTAFELLADLAVQDDGSIIATGLVAFPYGLNTSLIIKVFADGSFDSSFGDAGVITFSNGLYSYVSKILVQSDGNILVGGGATANSEDYLVYRFLPNGNADSSFGINGRSVINHDDCIDEIHDIGLLSDGRIVITGFQQSLVTNNPDFPLAILLPNGIPDSSFDYDGWTALDLQFHADESFALVVQPDDKVILAGMSYSYNNSGIDIGLARFFTVGVTGVSEVVPNTESYLKIYPNPATEIIQIENPFNPSKNNVAPNETEPVVFAVKNIYGCIMLTGTFSSQEKSFNIGLKNITAGIYVVELKYHDEWSVGKFIRN